MMDIFIVQKWLQVVLVFWLHQCIDCQCDDIPEFDFPNGQVDRPWAYDENRTLVKNSSVIQFRCLDGYLRIGVEYMLCIHNDTLGRAHWKGSQPFCAGMRCGDPPDVENAIYTIKSWSSRMDAGSMALYKCNEGYELQNVHISSLRCILDLKSDTAKWDGAIPICKMAEDVKCPDPGVSVNGERTGDCCEKGDTLEFTCTDGYTLVGNQTIMCRPSGHWTSDRPLCKPPSGYCEFPPPIPHGVLIPSETKEQRGDYFMIGEWAEVECNPGYKYVGRASKCMSAKGLSHKGVWKRTFGKCEEFVCKAPSTLLNGHIPEIEGTNVTIFPQNFLITYVCDKGFKLNESDSSRKCGRRGWTGNTPRCEAVKCPDPGSPENGYKIGLNYSIGDTVLFHCDGQYKLIGSYERQCKPNGQWSGILARCNIDSNYCPDPGKPINGWKNMTHYNMGDRVRFDCSPGYMMLGSEVRECLPNKTWSGHETRCLSYNDYDDEMQVSEKLKTVIAKKAEEQKKELGEFNKSRSLLEKPGEHNYYNYIDLNFPGRIILYFAFDVSGSIGADNLKKSIEFAKAVVQKVGISEHGARAGALTFSSKADILFWPMTFNTTEQVIKALDEIEFTGGGTSANSALEAIRTQHLPLVRQWIPETQTKSVLFILTDGKANMDGEPIQQAKWLKENEKVEIYCIGITGDIKQKMLYDIASSSKYGKNQEERPNVFILQNYKVLAWLVQEITNGTIDYSQCGFGLENIREKNFANIMGGNKSKEAWPWMAALFVNDDNPPKFRFSCGGSIIHPRFILTAAHCLYDKDNRLRDRSELLIKIGLTDRRDTRHQFEVRKIIKHPKYVRINSFDNDIALLELKHPIQFNENIRPICLPPKDKADLYLPDSIVWAAGWGENPRSVTVRGQPSRDLNEISLPIQSREKCLQSLRDEKPDSIPELFTHTMFCVGTGSERDDICKGDSGGPVMKSILNKDGFLSWTQVGIISWGDPGCGQKSAYDFQTKLQDFRDWVDEEIDKALKLLKP